jgi:hypothetical protein
MKAPMDKVILRKRARSEPRRPRTRLHLGQVWKTPGRTWEILEFDDLLSTVRVRQTRVVIITRRSVLEWICKMQAKPEPTGGSARRKGNSNHLQNGKASASVPPPSPITRDDIRQAAQRRLLELQRRA